MFNILGYKGNVNQNDTEFPSHPQNGYRQGKQATTNAGEDVGI
jgi:hypothetical protein